MIGSRNLACRDEVQLLCNKGLLDKAITVLVTRTGIDAGSVITSAGIGSGIANTITDDLLSHHISCFGNVQHIDAWLTILKACSKARALPQVTQVHTLLYWGGVLEHSPVVREHLSAALAKCGALNEAHHILLSWPCKSVVPWTALISAYTARGRGVDALGVHHCMQADGVEPNEYTFASLFKAYALISDLHEAHMLLVDAQRKGFASDIVVGSAIISMYSKCGCIVEAENTFIELPKHTIVSWTGMLSAYVEQGCGERALRLYRQMIEEGVNSDQVTFVITVQACGILAGNEERLVKGTQSRLVGVVRALHAATQKRGFSSDVSLCSTLTSTYGKCGCIMEAEDVFNRFVGKNVVAWTAMLSAYAEQGEGRKALQLYTKMQEEGFSPDQQTFAIVLRACAIFQAREGTVFEEAGLFKIAQALHDDAETKGFASHEFVSNTLISMYGKFGNIIDAEIVFCEHAEHDVVSWTAMLSIYVEQGQGEKGLQLYRQMQEEGVGPNQHTLVMAFQACDTLVMEGASIAKDEQGTQMATFEIVQALHADARKKGFVSDVFVCSTLISMYGKYGSMVEAENAFHGMTAHPDIVTWTALISAYVEQVHGEKALLLYWKMQEEGVSPDPETIVIILKACTSLAAEDPDFIMHLDLTPKHLVEIGRAIHADANQNGFISYVDVVDAVISMYGECGSIAEAETIFMQLSEHKVSSWNAILSAHVQNGQGREALQLYRQMQDEGATFNEDTFLRVLSACSITGNIETCKQLHFAIIALGYDANPVLGRSLIQTYCVCAHMLDGRAVFDRLPQHDVASWTACISGYAGGGNTLGSLLMFEEMCLARIAPDGLAFLSVLSACSHAGLVDEGIQLFESMTEVYGIIPTLKHYVAMMDLLGRAGEFKKLNQMMLRMPMQANWFAWMCVLCACCTYGNVELGKHVFVHAINLQSREASAYIQMVNLFADSRMRSYAYNVENLRVEKGAWVNHRKSWT